METLRDQIKNDLSAVFMNEDEFAQTASFFHLGVETVLTIQIFEEFQDFRTPTFFRIWCNFEDIPGIEENDYFIIKTKKYGVVSFTRDDIGNELTIFANEDNKWVA